MCRLCGAIDGQYHARAISAVNADECGLQVYTRVATLWNGNAAKQRTSPAHIGTLAPIWMDRGHQGVLLHIQDRLQKRKRPIGVHVTTKGAGQLAWVPGLAECARVRSLNAAAAAAAAARRRH